MMSVKDEKEKYEKAHIQGKFRFRLSKVIMFIRYVIL